jgi:serine/threonine-protein kinase
MPEVNEHAFARATPMEIVDLLLWAVAKLAGSITIVPDRERATHVIRHERAGTQAVVAEVPSRFGDALAARLAIVSGLPVGLPGAHVGRLRVRPAGSPVDVLVTELLVAVRATPAGLEAEAHRIAPGSAARDEDASPETLASGRGTIGAYRITGVLGQGGMGVVYAAKHVALDKPVALKVLSADAARRPRVAAQFLVEARAACRSRHRGIVDVTDFGALQDGRAYLVMELVTSPTLADVLLDLDGPMPIARAIAIARNIADALAAAAAHGVVHRDLTPSNVFVGDDDATKIGDFGLAWIASDDASAPAAGKREGGTAGFMSPEQWLGEPSDTRSDIYSFGVLLFRMVTGRLPFIGSSLIEILHMHVSDPVPRAIGKEGPVPEELQRILERAMAKGASERFQSFDELLLALDALEGAEPRSGWQRWRR